MTHDVDQSALTVIAPVLPEKEEGLRRILAQIDADVEGNAVIPFTQVSGVHFARFVLLPSGRTVQLAYAANIDGRIEDHLAAITAGSVRDGFAAVFSSCEGFDRSLDPAEAVRMFVARHRKRVHTFYRGHRGYTVAAIRSEASLYELLQKFLNEAPLVGLSPREAKARIEEHVARRLPGWTRPAPPRWPSVPLLLVAVGAVLLAALALAAGVAVAGWIAVLAALAGLLLLLRWMEFRAPELADAERDDQKISSLAASEDFIVQNQLTHLVELRPGLARRALEHVALFLINFLATWVYSKGRLGDIATIHFARWSVIDGGKRLLFFSNFDGSWENYLGDFVDRAAVGLTLAWSNTAEFPKTAFLAFRGATDEERFKAWARKYQIPTQVWYSAYENLTVKDILKNRAIASGIGKPMTDAEIQSWLTLL